MSKDVRIAENRMGSFALISALEYDLRGVILEEIVPKISGLDFLGNAAEKCKVRAISNSDSSDFTAVDLIQYLDFQDSFSILSSNSSIVGERIAKEIKRITVQLERIAGIRNRVMHGRPMEFDDYFNLSNFATEVPTTNGIRWTTLKQTLGEINTNPQYLLEVEIPIEIDNELVIHNLPEPDFDDTGFIGRADEIIDIKRRLKGNNKVVTILGNGGIGKSALALKVAYDLLDDENTPFEVIVWVEAKKNILTESGIQVIKDNVSAQKMIHEIHSEYSSKADENIYESTIEYLKEFKTLLVIDNLESILSEEIRTFIRDASLHSTILITSRIGLSELEYRMNLEGLKKHEAIKLLRQFASIRGLSDIAKSDQTIINKTAEILHYNPLAIRWYINSVAAGKSPLLVQNDQAELLGFCLENVFEHLGNIEHKCLKIILAYRSETISEAELLYILNIDHFDARLALSRLLATTFLRRHYNKTPFGMECAYSIPDFAKSYLTKKRILTKDEYATIQRQIRQLTANVQKIDEAAEVDFYSVKAISASSTSEKVAAKHLVEALMLCKIKKPLEEIEAKLLEATQLAPGYTEICRVSAFIKAEYGDYPGAEDEYLTGLGFDPKGKKLLFFYTGFLLTYLQDNDRALEMIQRLEAEDGTSNDVKILKSRCLAYGGDHDSAIAIIKPLAENSSLRNAKHRRVSVSLLLDYFRRKAENQYEIDHDRRLAIDTLKNAMDFYWVVYERHDVDHGIKAKANAVLDELRRICMRSKEKSLIDLFDAQSEKYHSRNSPQKPISPRNLQPVQEGVIVQLQDKYGFIESDTGDRYFFHQSSIIDDKDGIGLRIGGRVSFDFGKNHQGIAAINVACM